MNMPKIVYIIAEAGVNHNGSLELAMRLVEKAKESGADCVKFQTFKTENIVSRSSPKAAYQLKVTDAKESQFEMLKKLEMGKEHFAAIQAHCRKNGIDFLSTPYNEDDAVLLNELGVEAFKIASGQLVELPFLRFVAAFRKRMIISTGMADLAEVYAAVQAIRETGNNDIIVLQCNTDYPSRIEDSNLRAMVTMREALKVEAGYSDHVQDNYACYAAVALGATVIEKHFTLDRGMEGPDHSSSLEPEGFSELVKGIRSVESSLGSGIKSPSESERKNTFGMRRSLVARSELRSGKTLERGDFAFKRPASGLSPNHLDQLIGKKLIKDMAADEPFTMSHIGF